MIVNPCTRCGKERIFVRTWKEKIYGSTITTTENACPDPECQKIVEKENKERVEKKRSNELKRKMNLKKRQKMV